ncbi:branched-chain amino acid ABC transporter permease/ATP-binding protein [Actinocorallia populi]|uniref:branched-chain amino acid ABC transporter permease/ATP-binding protein n=1 Tax=Actinocorallia populi TaxID=2079200 RepID=UPI000D09692B|nr:branched-chain amino acid ABC transporter permease/ATP-binding protein [Actinocorallia populi]
MSDVGSLLLGLGNGGVFAALALAIVLTYRSSGVINFGTGAVALYVAYTYAALRDGELLVVVPGLPTYVDIGGPLGLVPALAISLAVAAALGALLYLLVFRPLREAPPLAKAVASLGVLTVIQTLLVIKVGGNPVSVDPVFPAERWEWGPVALLSDRFWLAVTVLLLTLALAVVFRSTRFGLLTRATAESESGAYLSGISPDRVALTNWMISTLVAGTAGILIAPLSPLAPSTYTLFVVPALAAAVVGRFQHMVPTVLAGLAIGMLQSGASGLAAGHSWLPQVGLSELVPLIVLVVALLATGRGMPVRGRLVRQPLAGAPRPRSLALPTVLGTAVGLIALLATTGTWRASVIDTFIAAIIGLSLIVVTGYAGQVSLAQLALAGTSAFTLAHLTQSWGVPFPVAPLLAAGVTVVIGVLVGIPALRLHGLTLGIVTLALAYAIEAVWFRNTDLVGTDGAQVAPPSLFGLDLSVGSGAAFPRLHFGLLCLFVLVLVAWGVARLRMSSLGLQMLAVRANENSAAGIGVNVVRVKVVSFAIASFIAGLGGGLIAYRQTVVTYESFTAIAGLAVLSAAYLAGVTSVSGGIIAGMMATTGIVSIMFDRWVHIGDWFELLGGLGVIGILIGHPEGLASVGHDAAARLRRSFSRFAPGSGRTSAKAQAPGVAAPPEPVTGPAAEPARGKTPPGAPPGPPRPTEPLLRLEGLTVHYGGVKAVSDLSLRIPAGAVVGLIGPNGAGKTSAIDAATGFAGSSGTVLLEGEHVEGLAPHELVRRGMARTFQSLELYGDLSVEENISAALAGVPVRERRRALTGALDLVGIGDRADRPARELSQGERQLVSIARACATGARVLLLDEPSAGLDTQESRWLGERIQGIADAGAGVLLVDHDISLVLDVCDYIYVLDFGSLIAEGTPGEIRADGRVAEAYLGSVRDSAEAGS